MTFLWLAGLVLFIHGKTLAEDQSSKSSMGNINIIPICTIQGDYFTSNYIGQIVRTRGVVFADLDSTSNKGFFIQQNNCDGDPATSDGIFIDLGEKQEIVNAGDNVEVQGVVLEDYGNTEISVITGTVTILSTDVELPQSQELHPPIDNTTSRWYFESIESMAVSLDDALVVGPTSSLGDTWVIRDDLGISRVYQDDTGTGEVVCISEEGLLQIEPEGAVGDRLLFLNGVMAYSYGDFCLLLTSQPAVITTTITTSPPLTPSNQQTITLATLNLHSLSDTVNDPNTDDSVVNFPTYTRRLQKHARLIHDVLGEPDLLAVQEVENETVLKDLAAFHEIEANYQQLLVNGPDLRGEDVALLYRSDRVEIIESETYQGCTTLVDGLGVDGNQDVHNPENASTCDSNGDNILDGNRLFSRPPLRVRVKVYTGNYGNSLSESDWVELTLLINHFKSKYEDGSINEYTLPRRLQEAQFIAGLVQSLHNAEPTHPIFVLGDLNDFPNSQPVNILTSAGLHDLTQTISHDERFTYNYQGVSQVLDYILYYPTPGISPMEMQVFHVNADYPYVLQGDPTTLYRASDHDPLLVTLLPMPQRVYFPLGLR